MAEVIKVLAQADPTGQTLTDMYTVPALTETVASTLVMCNRERATVEVRVSVAPGGAPDAPAQYLFFNHPIIRNDAVFATVGLTLAADDVVRVYTSAYGVSFSLYGTEVT